MSAASSPAPSALRAVILDWQVAAAAHTAVPTQWQMMPALAEILPSTLTIHHWRELPVSNRNEILHALMVLSRQGDELSIKTIMTLFLFFVTRRCSTATCLRGMTLQDAQALVMPAMWEALTHRNPPKSATQSAGTLIMNTMNVLCAESSAANRRIGELEVVPAEADQLELAAGPQLSTSQDEVAELLAWALDTKALSQVEVRILTLIHLTGVSSTQIARDLGLSTQQVSKISVPARRKLKEAVQAHISTWGTW